jgi:hypothetical protein
MSQVLFTLDFEAITAAAPEIVFENSAMARLAI